ncbi:hypothetical protein EYF80_065364 [Liparis tanakae]|uniref:Uncharacterized protein n=1 Tax=Liparis tanakae TaxID=230148 RepID=A0A4Z2E7G8_9TELE|nr:hypothetical protein EYF80_065364 [Liparis tanakae]
MQLPPPGLHALPPGRRLALRPDQRELRLQTRRGGQPLRRLHGGLLGPPRVRLPALRLRRRLRSVHRRLRVRVREERERERKTRLSTCVCR